MEMDTEELHHSIAELIGAVSSPSEIRGVFDKLVDAYGLQTIAYFGQNITRDKQDVPYLAVTYTLDWVDHYIEQDYVAIDPVVKEGFHSILPIDWRKFDCRSPKLKKFFGESLEFGLGRNGVTIPVRGPGNSRALVTLTSNETTRAWNQELEFFTRDFLILAYMIHDMICRVEDLEFPIYRLAPRELECLKWACRGKTVSETAIILSISDRTVRFYLDLARNKLNSCNVTHAVSKALSGGLISTH